MIEMILSGFLFLFILVLNIVMGAFGYLMEKDDYNPDADLKKINKNPQKFKMGIGLALIERDDAKEGFLTARSLLFPQ